MKTPQQGRTGNPAVGQDPSKKKIRAAHARRNNKYGKRATARIALTCYIGQPGQVGVRIFYEDLGSWGRFMARHLF
jgi:hypothetical protein